MMTTTKMILASALLALTTSPAMAQSLRVGTSARQSPPSAVQLIKKAQAAAEAGKTLEAQELMAKATAMLTHEAEQAAKRAAAIAADQAAVDHARQVAAMEAHAAAAEAHEHAQAAEQAHGLTLVESGTMGAWVAHAPQELEVHQNSPFRGRMVLSPTTQSPGGLAPQALNTPPVRWMGSVDRGPGMRRAGRPQSSQQGNGMEELLRGIHQELRGIRQELSGIRESLSGGHGQTRSHGGGETRDMWHSGADFEPLHAAPHPQSRVQLQWGEAVRSDVSGPTMEWHQVEGSEIGPQTGVIFLGTNQGLEGEAIQYRLLSPQGDGEMHDSLIQLGYVSGEDHEVIILENAEMELHRAELEKLHVELETLELLELESILQAVNAEASVEIELAVELEKAAAGALQPRIRVRSVKPVQPVIHGQLRGNVVVPVPPAPPAPAAAPLPVRQRVRIIETTPEEDPDVQPEDPFFRPAQPASEPTPAKPVITAAGIFGG